VQGKIMRLENRVALITGGAAGIGEATAERFAAEGAIVCICDMAEEAGQAVAARLKARFDKVNITDHAAVVAWVNSVLAQHGRVDILVNNAGILRDGQLVKAKDGEVVGMMSEADFDAVISVNLKGVFNGTQAVVPPMIKQGSGVILNASSVVGLDGNFGQTNYVASKAGVVGMTKVWARELGRYGIRVNAVAPGFIATAMTASMPEKVLESMVQKTPLRRMGKPEDIANAYLWLASDEASFVTGHCLRVDGGVVVGT
jgi:3-oxoacyl-[acyl-carrier protein] reductase